MCIYIHIDWQYFLQLMTPWIQWNTIRITSFFVLCIIIGLSLIYHSIFSFYRLYAVGGRDGSSCLKSVECFDPHTNKWTLCAQMSKRRGGVGVTTWNGLLYAIGGHDAPASNLTSRLSDCVERYFLWKKTRNEWTNLSSDASTQINNSFFVCFYFF